MEMLQCPFTWKSRILSEVEIKHRKDKLPLAPTPWACIITKLGLAYSAHRHGMLDEAREHMVGCFTDILPFPAFDTGCEVVNTYKVALKHVLESTWVFMKLSEIEDKDLDMLLSKILQYKEMGIKDQAAVVAIRASLSKSPKNVQMIRKAILMSPVEGQWHCMLGKMLLLSRLPKTAGHPTRCPDEAEHRALSTAYRLREDPETCTLLSESWLDHGPKGYELASIIINDALKLFPNSASAHARCARVLWLMPPPHLNLLKVEYCYRRALSLAPNCLFLHFKLGGVCVILDKLLEARHHYAAAASMYPEARDVLDSLRRLPNIDGPITSDNINDKIKSCRDIWTHPFHEEAAAGTDHCEGGSDGPRCGGASSSGTTMSKETVEELLDTITTVDSSIGVVSLSKPILTRASVSGTKDGDGKDRGSEEPETLLISKSKKKRLLKKRNKSQQREETLAIAMEQQLKVQTKSYTTLRFTVDSNKKVIGVSVAASQNVHVDGGNMKSEELKRAKLKEEFRKQMSEDICRQISEHLKSCVKKQTTKEPNTQSKNQPLKRSVAQSREQISEEAGKMPRSRASRRREAARNKKALLAAASAEMEGAAVCDCGLCDLGDDDEGWVSDSAGEGAMGSASGGTVTSAGNAVGLRNGSSSSNCSSNNNNGIKVAEQKLKKKKHRLRAL